MEFLFFEKWYACSPIDYASPNRPEKPVGNCLSTGAVFIQEIKNPPLRFYATQWRISTVKKKVAAKISEKAESEYEM